MAEPIVNYLAVLVCGFVSMIVGSFWYSPIGFGLPWMRLMGITPKDVQKAKAKNKSMFGSYLIMFIAVLVMAFVLSHFLDYAEADTFLLGMQGGFWAWLGFIATTMTGSVLWEQKSWKLYLINAGHYLVTLVLMGGILAAWQ